MVTKRNKMVSDSRRRNSDLLPIDLIMEIFKRLPVKTLARFLCLSKLWASMIRRPDFMKLYLAEFLNRPGRLFISSTIDRNSVLYSSLQTHNPGEASVATYLRTHPLYSNAMNPSNVHGLICYETAICFETASPSELVVYNSSTRRSISLPRFEPKSFVVRHLLGYDPIDGVYKVLCLTQPRTGPRNIVFQVLTLGSGNSWKVIENSHTQSCLRSQICINGVLYYEAYNYTHRCTDGVVISFDVRSEKFDLIKRPDILSKIGSDIDMIRYGGKLAITSRTIPHYVSSIVLWVLEDAVKHEWSKKVFVLPPSWTSLTQFRSFYYHRLIHVTDAGELLLAPTLLVDPVRAPYCVLYCDPERNSVTRVEIKGITKQKLPRLNSLFQLSSTQLESLMFL